MRSMVFAPRGLLVATLTGLALAGCHVEQARIFPGTIVGATGASGTASVGGREIAECAARIDAPSAGGPTAAVPAAIPAAVPAAIPAAIPAIGEVLTCRCPVQPRGLVRGTGLYAPDSAICAAALHDGVIDGAGGVVTLQIGGASPFFRGSLRHGVRSLDGEAQARSFVFRRPAPAPSP